MNKQENVDPRQLRSAQENVNMSERCAKMMRIRWMKRIEVHVHDEKEA